MNDEVMLMYIFISKSQKKISFYMTENTAIITTRQYKLTRYILKNSTILIGSSQFFYRITFDLLRYLKFIKKFEDSEHFKRFVVYRN